MIGGWIYLPQHKMGIIAEQDAVEAYEALVYLQVPFYLTLLVTLVLVGINVASGLTIRKLRKTSLEDRQIGYYRVGKQIGKGGMGEVYRAEHALLKRPTALKILRRGIDGDEDHLRSFQREVTLAAQLEHPNTISIFDYGLTPEGDFFYTMELLKGRTLEEITKKEGPQPATRVVHVLRQVAGSLAEAHQNGLVHSDIKPANVMLCRRAGMDDVAKVLDFGLVTHLGRLDDAPSRTRLRGTIRYMAPERITRPGSTSFAVDIYGLGILGYTLLTGHDPFLEDEEVDMTTQVLNIDPYPSHVPAEATELMQVILKCLQKNPAERWTSARAFLSALDDLHLAPWNPEVQVQELKSNNLSVKVLSKGQWQGPRKDQEDRLLAHEGRGILAVADGMGGHPGGGEAAEFLISALKGLEADAGQREAEEAVARAIQHMEGHAAQHPEFKRMGCTLVLFLQKEGGMLCWSGDSRAYLLEKGSYPQRLTEDHSQGGLLTRWVGPLSGSGMLEWRDLSVAPGQRILLATDGFYKAWEAAGFPPPEEKAVQKQLAGMFQDNATFVLMELQYI